MTTGPTNNQTDAPTRPPQPATPLVSSGFVRGKQDRLMLIQGTGTHGPAPVVSYAQEATPVTALREDGAGTGGLAALDWQKATTVAAPVAAPGAVHDAGVTYS